MVYISPEVKKVSVKGISWLDAFMSVVGKVPEPKSNSVLLIFTVKALDTHTGVMVILLLRINGPLMVVALISHVEDVWGCPDNVPVRVAVSGTL